MKLPEFFQQFEFHDSSLEALQYDVANAVCTLKITLLNSDQRWYQQGDPELVGGEAIVSGVSKIELEPETGLLKDDGTSDGEILSVRQVDGDEHCWTWDIIDNTHIYQTGSRYFILTLCATDVVWRFVDE